MSESTHVYSAVLIGAPDQPLDVKVGSITLDAGSAPHVQADLTIGPVSQTVYDALDPRLRPRVRIQVDAITVAGVQSRTFDLGVRSRPIGYRSGDYGLTLASDEALLFDYAPLVDDLVDPGTTGRQLVEWVLDVVIPGAELAPGGEFTIPPDADGEALRWRSGVNALEFLEPILQACGFRLVCDEHRVWTLRDEGYIAPGFLVLRHSINIIDANETIDLDARLWFHAAVTRYRWTDTAGVLHEVSDYWTSVIPPATPTVVKTFDKQTAFPGAGFSAYAVRRAQGRGREVSATVVSDWTATAEQAIEIVLPNTPTQTGVTRAVRFDLRTDEMTVTTQTVDTPAGAIDLLVGTIDALVGTIDEL